MGISPGGSTKTVANANRLILIWKVDKALGGHEERLALQVIG